LKEILLNLERCNGCLSCAIACAVEHAAGKAILGPMLEKVRPRLNVEPFNGKAIPILCRHCEEPACVDACMAGAMQKDEKSGFVTNEGWQQECVGCWMCVMACPYGAIVQGTGSEKKALKCDRCPQREVPACVASCPTEALLFAEPDQFSKERRRKTVVALTGTGI
jgi:carbon-monoxide dehydrogenase iron sulfur subunit